MSNILDQFTIVSQCNGSDHDASHLVLGDYCAITQEGLDDHNLHNFMSKAAVYGTVGLIALPVAIGGGVGIVAGGEAVGLGLAELGLVGAGGGAAVAAGTRKRVEGYLRDDKHKTLTIVDMVGTVLSKRNRWWDQPGQDVKVRWVGADSFGNRTTFVAWHNPEQLVKLAQQGV